MGGWSNEREISLVSGKSVYNSLISSGVDALELDLDKNNIYYEEGYTECCKMPQLEQGKVKEVKSAAERTASKLLKKIEKAFPL